MYWEVFLRLCPLICNIKPKYSLRNIHYQLELINFIASNNLFL